MSELPVICVKDASFGYGRVNVLDHVNLDIFERELLSVVGPNGGGKTTLIKLILGLIQPDSGTVQVFGSQPEKSRKLIGYMPQHSLFDPKFPVTVLEIVMMGRLGWHLIGAYSKKDHQIALEALDMLGMSDYSSRLFAELSGGQKQRVLIARALACKPRILLLDEPTANVDIKVEEQLMDTIKRLNAEMTILLVSHDLGFVADVVERVICVNRQVAIHPTSHLTNEIIREIYDGDLKIVRHDHNLESKRHDHD
jgi:zinc transport system ATP-binding protein